MLFRRHSSEQDLRYRCLSPSGGATSCSREIPAGIFSPQSAQWVCMFTMSARMNPLTSGSTGHAPLPMPVILPSSEVTHPSLRP